MKKRYIGKIVGLAMAMATLVTVSANATIVNLANYGVGYVRPTLLGSAFTITELQNMINVYNGDASSPIAGENYYVTQGSSTPNPDLLVPLTLAGNPPGGTAGNGQTSMNLDLGVGGYAYLVCQWDGPNGANAIYYIGGLSGIITIVNDLGTYTGTAKDSDYGLSHTYLVVPEPSTVVAGALLLLPFGASTIRILRKNRAA